MTLDEEDSLAGVVRVPREERGEEAGESGAAAAPEVVDESGAE